MPEVRLWIDGHRAEARRTRQSLGAPGELLCQEGKTNAIPGYGVSDQQLYQRLGRFLFADFALAEEVQAKVGDDAVEPGVEAAIEAEGVEIAMDAEEGLLVDIAGVLLGAQEVEGEAEDGLIVGVDELLEGELVARLRRSDECRFVRQGPFPEYPGRRDGIRCRVQHGIGRVRRRKVTLGVRAGWAESCDPYAG